MSRSTEFAQGYHPESTISFRGGAGVTAGKFFADCHALSNKLPEHKYAMNICSDRYNFMLGLASAMMRGQTTLLPHTILPESLAQIEEEYPDLYCLYDKEEPVIKGEALSLAGEITKAETACFVSPSFPHHQPAVIVFTSGSTGKPSSHLKSWGSLVKGADESAKRFGIDKLNRFSVVATVPHQHMYGFESSIIQPLQSGGSSFSSRSFFPEDIRKALEAIKEPRLLVTTPIHLKSLVAQNPILPKIEFILSATAPLSAELAGKSEKLFNTKVFEIFGCTEAGAFASRRTIDGNRWKTYHGVTIKKTNDSVMLDGGHIDCALPLSDSVELFSDTEFVHIGRGSEMINIAGKRASLGGLNHKLNQIEGVEDGLFFISDGDGSDGNIERLACCVVAPEKNSHEITKELKKKIDSVFLPRPLLIVDKIPRNDTGKITRKELNDLANRLKG